MYDENTFTENNISFKLLFFTHYFFRHNNYICYMYIVECKRDVFYLRFIECIYYRLYPAGMNFVSISLTTLRSTQWAIKKNPVPVVKPGTKKQLIFLNFSVRGNRYIEQIQFVQSFDMKYRSICVHFVVPVIQVIDYEL